MIRVLRAADRVAAPWKNGGGVTREVAIWPERASFGDFDWRVSIADVREAGPFSKFENIDRTILILQGRLALTVEDRTVELHTGSAPFAFPGDAACSGTPVGGAVMDLNVMTRRGRWTADVERIEGNLHAHAKGQALIVAPAPAIIATEAQSYDLRSLDALLIDESKDIGLFASARVIAIALTQA